MSSYASRSVICFAYLPASDTLLSDTACVSTTQAVASVILICDQAALSNVAISITKRYFTSLLSMRS